MKDLSPVPFSESSQTQCSQDLGDSAYVWKAVRRAKGAGFMQDVGCFLRL